jgi:hypothetical protein
MGYFEHMDLYSPRRYEPRSDSERIDYIMRLLERDPATEGSPATDAADYGGSPSTWRPASESQRGAGVYRREYLPPDQARPAQVVYSGWPLNPDPSNPTPDAIRSLGDEMVMLAGGLAAMPWRALPIAIRVGRQGIASVRGLTEEAEAALNALGQSFRNRFGRGPTGRELTEALSPLTKGEPNPAEQDGLTGGSEPAGVSPSTSGRWPVSDALQALGEMQDRIRGLGGRTFQTYTKRGLDEERYYSGMTSGTKSPYLNVARRDSNKYPSPNYHPAELDKSSSRYSSIRGREQNLIDYYKQHDIADNKKNSIWRKNRLRNYFLRNAEQEFGSIEKPEED